MWIVVNRKLWTCFTPTPDTKSDSTPPALGPPSKAPCGAPPPGSSRFRALGAPALEGATGRSRDHHFFTFALPLAVFFLRAHIAPETRTPRLDLRHLQAFSWAQLRSRSDPFVYVAWRDACRSRVTSTRSSKTTACTTTASRSSVFSSCA